MSWVFLTEDRAYKLKKPVLRPFLDHRRLEARRRDCEAEVELNRALAPGVYLGTVPLTGDLDGSLALDGAGPVVDWLVVMRRLPDDSFLGHRLGGDGRPIRPGEVSALVDHLADFYRTAERRPTDPAAYRRGLVAGIRADRAGLLGHNHAVDREAVTSLVEALEWAVADRGALDHRCRRLVDGHGDLRPEHVVLGPTPLILDRITFDDRLRRIDPACDLALLAVECELLGAAELGGEITDRCLERIGDAVSAADAALYRALRATTRARLSLAHLVDSDRDAGKWLDRTDAYLAIATAHQAAFRSGDGRSGG